MNGGWFPDPTGRFAQRWYDGHRWSEQVVAANGTVITDVLPGTGQALAPPPARPVPQTAQTGPPAAATWQAPPGPGPGPSTARLLPGATLVVGVVGLLLVAASLLGVPWFTGGGRSFSFLDLSEAARDSHGDGEAVARLYAAFGGFLLVAATLVGVVLAGIPLPGRGGAVRWWRISTAAVAGLAAIAHTWTVVRVSRGPATPEIGAWLGVAGYVVVIVAMVVGHHRRRAQ